MSEASDSPPSSGVEGDPFPRRRPSDLAQWSVVALSQFRDYLRTYRFLGLVAFVGVVSVVWFSFLIAAGRGVVQVSYLASVSEFLVDYCSSTPTWVFLAAAFFGGEAMSVDFNTGAGSFTLVLPVKRWTLLAGRYASATAVTLVVAAEFTAFGVLAAAYEFGRDSIPWGSVGTSLELAALLTFAAVAMAFCFSSFFRSPTTGVLVTVVVLLVAMPTMDWVTQIAGYEPWFSITWASGAVGSALDWAYVPKQVIPIGGGQVLTTWSASTDQGAWIMVAYLVVFAFLSVVLYQLKESKG